MHLLSPDRPQIAHRPAYVNSLSQPIAPIPNLTLQPGPDGKIRIDLLVKHSDGAFGYVTKVIEPEHLQFLWEAWVGDPEEAMQSYWGYTPPVGTKSSPPSRPTISLADLGLA